MVRVEIIGNLGRDVTIHESKVGGKFAALTVAAREFVNGEEKTQWFDCVWFDYNEKMIQFLKKGSGIYLTGSLDIINEVGGDGATYLRRKVNVDYVTFNSTGSKPQDENGAASAPAQTVTSEKVPSMYASKEPAAKPQVPEAPVVDKTFQPELMNNSDLPF